MGTCSLPPNETTRHPCRVFQGHRPHRLICTIIAFSEEVDYDGLATSTRGIQNLRARLLAWRLGYQNYYLGALIFFQQSDSLHRCHAANLLREVVSSCPYRVRYSQPLALEKRGDLLNARSRSRDDSDRASAHDVSESEHYAVDDRGPAVRPHDKQASRLRSLLQLDLVFTSHVAAEEEDVETTLEGIHRLPLGKSSWDGYQGQVCVGHHLDSGSECPGANLLRLHGFSRREHLLDSRDRRFEHLSARRLYRDDQIVWARLLYFAPLESCILEESLVERCSHQDGRLRDSLRFRDLVRDFHECHRVSVVSFFDDDLEQVATR